MLSTTFPYPPTNGGIEVRTFNLLKYLSERHAITLVTQHSEDITEDKVAKLRKWVEELIMFPQPKPLDNEKGIRSKVQRWSTFLQQGTPQSVLDPYSTTMQQWVDEAVESGKFEVITCEHSMNEIYIHSAWRQQLQTVVNIHSSVYRKHRNQVENSKSDKNFRDQLNLPLLRRYEERYCAKFTNIVVATPTDRRQIEDYEPEGKIALVPNGVDLTQFPKRVSDPGGQRLVFIGTMDSLTNIDAVKFFSLEVFPEVLRRYPEATLEIVGARPTPEILELQEHPGITIAGSVSSTANYLHKATVCVVPLQTSYGIKNETLEAMAAGVPVVGSDRGLEGLAVDGADVPLRALRANEPAEYVYAVSRLFEDRQLRKQLSENGRKLVEKKYTWQKAGELYEQVLMGK
nr:glycosyltransferase family 4 protein [Coleofasciculus sp. LEGE 07092]